MTGKVGQQGAGRVNVGQTAKTNEAVKAAPPPPKQELPQLNERDLRRTGKASGFTKSFTPLSSGPQEQVKSDAPTMSASQLQRGGQLPTKAADIAEAEKAVAFNSGHDTPRTMDEVKKNPKAFLRDVVQLDGRASTNVDQTACGPTAVIMGLIAGRPAALEDLAKKLMNANGTLTADGASLANELSPGTAEDFADALKNIRNGEFTPGDVTQLAASIQELAPEAGSAGKNLEGVVKIIEKLGVKVPKMELQQFGPKDGSMGHWRVVSNGTQFNPWPNAKGQSTQVPADQALAAGKKDGTNWVLRESITVGSK